MDFNQALAQKYAILQQQADTSQTEAAARAKLLSAQAQVMPSQALHEQAQAELLRQQAQLAPMEAQSLASYRGAMGQQAQAQSGLTSAQQAVTEHEAAPISPDLLGHLTQQLSDYSRIYGTQNLNLPGFNGPPSYQGAISGTNGVTVSKSVLDKNPDGSLKYSKGTSKVPGKGSGAVDTVPAKLAPGEAVLNKGANDIVNQHLPPGFVDTLNAIGAHKMAQEGHPPQQGGMPPAKGKGKGKPAKKAGK